MRTIFNLCSECERLSELEWMRQRQRSRFITHGLHKCRAYVLIVNHGATKYHDSHYFLVKIWEKKNNENRFDLVGFVTHTLHWMVLPMISAFVQIYNEVRRFYSRANTFIVATISSEWKKSHWTNSLSVIRIYA